MIKITHSLFLSVLFLVGFVAIAVCQQDNNNADKTLRGSGRINPSTLAMEFDLPMASYPGRGINVPVSISYSSKVWRMNWLGSIDGGIVTGGCRSLNEAKYSENSASGWTTSLAVPYIEYTGKDHLYNSHGFPLDDGLCVNAPPPTDNGASWIRRVTVHLPSGETHELRAGDTPLTYDRSSTCPPANGYGCDPNMVWLQANWNSTFYAVDGSNIKYIEDANTNTYKLLMPDGSFYDFSSSLSGVYDTTARRATTFTDRNGNYTTYNSSTSQWTDTLGRTLSSPIPETAPTSPTVQTYTLLGMTGQYKFHWKKLKGDTATESALTDFYQDLKYTGDKIAMGNNGNWSVHPSGTYLFTSTFDSYVKSSLNVFNPIVLAEIELPTGQSYQFSYDVFGQLEQIKYPTGGKELFTYGFISALTPSETDSIISNLGVTDRKLYKTETDTSPYEWTYTAGYVDSKYVTTVNNPDGTKTQSFLFQGNPSCVGCTEGDFGYDNGLAGMPAESQSFDSSGTLISRSIKTWTKKSFSISGGSGIATADWHPRVTQEESIVYDAVSGDGVSATTKYEYEGDLNLRDTPLLVNKTTQYAFVAVSGGAEFNLMERPCDPGDEGCEPPEPSPTPTPSPSPTLTPIKIVETTYLINDSNYTGVKSYYIAQNMIGLATVATVKDGAGIVITRSEYIYDESGRSPGYRGNPTSLRVWDSSKGTYSNSSAYIATHSKFDSFGNQYEATDAKGCSSTTVFDSTYQTYPTQVTTCAPSDGSHGANAGFVSTATFDFTTGLPLTTTNANGLETRITYDSATLRSLNTKTYYNNSQVGSTSETIYHDEPNNFWIKNRSQIDTDKWVETITYFDGLGRAWKTEEVNSLGNIFTEKEYDEQGRVKRVSNPFRANETKVWTTNIYDEASRITEVDLQDGSKVTTEYGVSVSGVVGLTKQITDQAGKKRKGITDTLGHMVRVIEDPTGQNLSTDYIFDILGSLRKTTQGTQNRFFMHDSLGRLVYAKQPEQDTNSNFTATDPITGNTGWSEKYEYDDNGNIFKTTDAKNSYVQATYDNLNRIVLRDYSDSATPDVSFYYDGTGLSSSPTGAKLGQLTKLSTSVSETRNLEFDDFGRVLSYRQSTGGQNFDSSYEYNIAGLLTAETYPSGRRVEYSTDENGDLSNVKSRKNSGAGFWAYASGFKYNTAGMNTALRLGNGHWETTVYNDRQQITKIGLGVTDNDRNLLELEYGYESIGNHDNNGNPLEQKIKVPAVGSNPAFTAVQTYSYDGLNRLNSAEEKVSGTTTWKQTFTIDRFGNRTFDAGNTTTLGSCSTAICNPSISTNNNRITSSGYTYDANGALTQNASGERFGYDAENHQTKFFNSNNSGSTSDAEYIYDGDGKRVMKTVGSDTTIFVYDALGKVIAEYATVLATTQQVSYLTQDGLGSPRVTTNENGEVTSRKDFMAYGDEALSVQRTSGPSGNNYDTPQFRTDYTGYEKDDESGLQFAQARYFNPMHGRYTTVDPMTASATIRNPQSFNRYAYVNNSPVKNTDPLGLSPVSWNSSFGGGGGFCSAARSSCEEGGDEELTTPSIEAYQKQQQEQERKRQQEKKKKAEAKKQTKQAAKKPKAPPTPAQKKDEFRSGIPEPAKSGAPRPARASIVGPLEGDTNGRPNSYRNIYKYQQTLLIQVSDQFGNAYYVTDSEGNAPYVEEKVDKVPGGTEPPELAGRPPQTANGDLNSDGRIADVHTYGLGFGGPELPDNLDVVKRQTIWVTAPDTNQRYEVGRFEYRWTKNTLTVTDYTRGEKNAKTYVY